jgi:hypothetical protein
VRAPPLLLHADFGLDPRKRWVTRAEPTRGGFFLTAPEPCTPALVDAALGVPRALFGFDFPIGVPRAWAARAGVARFVDLVLAPATPAWASFFEVAREPAEIGPRRPFYPARPGGRSRAELASALGLASARELFRACELAPGQRPCPIFWTLGGNQVGKGALAGWREIVVPARTSGRAALWPFDGPLDALLEGDRAVLAESYPADAYARVGATLPSTPDGRGKRVRASRAAGADAIGAWASGAGVTFSPELARAIRDGFGDDAAGEDRFDATLGALGLVDVLLGRRPHAPPAGGLVREVEGWILGRSA